MFTDLYLKTTDPRKKLTQWLDPSILVPIFVSVLFHTIAYTGFCNLVSFIFFSRLLNPTVNVRLVVSLLCIMCVGFVARYYHVQEVYRAYHGNMEKTRQHLDRQYVTWIFLS
jgi:hypothetical protein